MKVQHRSNYSGALSYLISKEIIRTLFSFQDNMIDLKEFECIATFWTYTTKSVDFLIVSVQTDTILRRSSRETFPFTARTSFVTCWDQNKIALWWQKKNVWRTITAREWCMLECETWTQKAWKRDAIKNLPSLGATFASELLAQP